MTPTPAPEPRSRPGPAAERGPRVFYGWWIVGGGFVISLLSGGLMFHAFSGYVLPLQREFGWSRSLISGAFSMAQAEGGLLGPAQGWLIDKFGPRALMRVGITMFGAGFILLSQVNGVVTFYAVFALLAIGSSLGTFLPMATIITNWFSRRRSMALGIFMTGMSAGGLLVPAIVWSLTTHGWRTTALVSGFLVLGIGLPMTQLMRRRPEDYGLLPDGAEQPPASASAAGAPAAEAAGPDDPDFTIGQALRTSSFWLLGIGHGAALLVVGAAIVHQIPHMVEGIGLSEGAASSIVALLVGTMIVGQLAGGYVGDRVDKRLVVTGCLLLHAAALLVFAFATTAWGAVAFAMMHGTAWGVRVPLVIAMRADYFGRKAYAQVMGFSSLVMMVGMTGGPLFGGFMRDMTGNYTTAFVILAVFAAAGSFAMLAARKPTPPGAGASG